jgi:ribosomal protein S18 acetylase RimI-like enzyme
VTALFADRSIPIVRLGNLDDPRDAEAFLSLIEVYMNDPKGSGSKDNRVDRCVVERLRSYPHVVLFFAEISSEAVGMAVCFLGFSTFKAKELINIHDFIVTPNKRRSGVGAALMKAVLDYASRRDCCKVTLEVREDNFVAQQFYRTMGFSEEPVPMWFWTQYL